MDIRSHLRRTGRRTRRLLATALLLASACAGQAAQARDVVLLHGLNRTSASMEGLAGALAKDGYRVHNLDYPSSWHEIAWLADWLARRLDACCATAAAGEGLDFVTHSLGGILVRELARQHPHVAIRRVVMLAPPNRGTELVDALAGSALFQMVTGPVGQQLGTGHHSVPLGQGPVRFTLGVVAGRSSLNPVYSWIIPGDDDGTVAVVRTRVEGMQDFVVVDANHTFVMQSQEVIRQVRHFLREGVFDHH